MLPTLLALAIIACLILVVLCGQPDEFAVARAAKFTAPPEKVFPHVNHLAAWAAWSPWAKMDPHAKNSLTGPPAGVGAALHWEGRKVGIGTMTITDSQPNNVIRFRLDFEKPMQAVNTAEFNFLPADGGTAVTWRMAGENTLPGKVMGLFMNCEQMVNRQFDQGLADLKSICEGTAK